MRDLNQVIDSMLVEIPDEGVGTNLKIDLEIVKDYITYTPPEKMLLRWQHAASLLYLYCGPEPKLEWQNKIASILAAQIKDNSQNTPNN